MKSFVQLGSADRTSAMVAHVLAMEDEKFGPQTLMRLVKSASDTRQLAAFREVWMGLLRSSDPRMATETFDRYRMIGPGGVKEEKIVNRRVDDSWFKEQILYMMRDNTEPDSQLVEELFEAFKKEKIAMTRMRIVRCIGTIGGARTRPLLQQVVDMESGDNTRAAQEAAKWLRGETSPLGITTFSAPKGERPIH